MTFDPNTISSEAKSAFVALGKYFSSNDTLTQAQLTSNAYAQHGPALEAHGYSPEDAADLKDYMGALIAATVGRQDARADKKQHSAAYSDSFQRGKKLRMRTMAIARNIKGALLKMEGSEEKAAVLAIQSVLDLCSESPVDGATLANQLEQFIPLFKNAAIANAALKRGGAGVLAELEISAPGLRAASHANITAKGTPAQTELMDLLDGLIVENCRAARRAARSASRELGESAIAKTFALSALRKVSKKGAKAPVPA